MKLKQNQAEDFDANKIWEELQRVAARAPEWASTEPPYPVKSEYKMQKALQRKVGEPEHVRHAPERMVNKESNTGKTPRHGKAPA